MSEGNPSLDPASPKTPSGLGVRAFYRGTETGEIPAPRLSLLISLYQRHRIALNRQLSVLDVGCGRDAVLSRYLENGDSYAACDIVPTRVALANFKLVDLNQDRLDQAFGGQKFDVIFCSEVIEHVFSPDHLLEQIRSLMSGQSLLVLSTPNLAYWANRLLLLAGISPLFLENSSEVKLGRRTKLLGQGHPTEGHIRVFTHRAVLDLIKRQGWRLLGVTPIPAWNFPIDRLICRFSPALAPGNVYQLGA